LTSASLAPGAQPNTAHEATEEAHHEGAKTVQSSSVKEKPPPSHLSAVNLTQSTKGLHQTSEAQATYVPSNNNDNSSTNPTTKHTRRIISEDPEWNLSAVPKLSDICVKVIVKNFERMLG
jgi:hypothetical protein